MARRSGGGWGLIGVVVVVTIVLLLWAKNARRVAPTAMDVRSGGAAAAAEPEAAEEVRSGRLPDLGDMREATSAYTEHVDETRAAIDAAIDGPEDER